jgi:DNA-binding CsgD family transcriptional regulator
MADLSRLNDAERRVLAMFGEGHTAKSIASATGASVHSVNERLREARRKTGVGSSRELARLLRAAEGAQENRDEPIGIAAAPGIAPASVLQPHRSRTAMIAFILVPLAAFAGAYLAPRTPAGPPYVVSTSPAQDARVPAGPLLLRVTFDQPMKGDRYSFVSVDAAPAPKCDSRARALPDGRSFEMRCTLEPGRDYAIGFNSARFRNFVGTNGLLAEPAVLRFSTR